MELEREDIDDYFVDALGNDDEVTIVQEIMGWYRRAPDHDKAIAAVQACNMLFRVVVMCGWGKIKRLVIAAIRELLSHDENATNDAVLEAIGTFAELKRE